MGSSAHMPIGFTSLAFEATLSDSDGNIFTDNARAGRADALSALGSSGAAQNRDTVLTSNQWWLVRVHIDHTGTPGVFETWIRRPEGPWIKISDTTTSSVVSWVPVSTLGHRAIRFPTTANNWYQEPRQQTTHGDWWIYIDDFAIARGVHAGGNGVDDLPSYP
jgi:hypothetical protein